MKRITLILFWILTATVVCSAQTTFYYPHVADGVLGANIWKTSIFLTNPSASGTASGTITFTKDNCPPPPGDCSVTNPALAGSPFPISFTDEIGTPTSGTITFSIPAGSTKKYLSSGAGTYGGGFAVVSSSVGTVNGTAIFSEFDLTGRLVGEAGVPAVPAVPKQAIFVDTTGGFNIALAYANPGSTAGSVTLSLLNSSAVTVAGTPVLLGQGNHRALFTSQLFPGQGPLVGTVQITSTAPLAVIALRFDPSFTIFTTLPPVTLSSLMNPAMEWLQQRAWLAPLTSIARLLGAFQVRSIA